MKHFIFLAKISCDEGHHQCKVLYYQKLVGICAVRVYLLCSFGGIDDDDDDDDDSDDDDSADDDDDSAVMM